MSTVKKNVLIVGGTRFSGLYLWKELHDRGHSVTLFNRGKTALQRLPKESHEGFEKRCAETQYLKGDRQNAADLATLGDKSFDVVYDMNGREAADTAPLADLFNGKVEHFVYMSSAGVYKKSPLMPHHEADAVDEKSRHKGKLETEAYLQKIGIPYTSIRPTYIYGPLNYNTLEEYFFTRLTANQTVCIPGHGHHITGLGHVEDLAVAMAQVIGREQAIGKVYNIQDVQSVTFEDLALLCGRAMGEDLIRFCARPKGPLVRMRAYDPKDFDFGKLKLFPMRPQHFFCSVDEAMRDLDWAPKHSLLQGLTDSYLLDFTPKLEAGLVPDFTCDIMVLKDQRVVARHYDGVPSDNF
ncbi:38 kDa ribosome-associated protein precursor [Ochromonadaceae sp. CCMP2298]|nr:38 kDa ribosome-associated protein precursor [Ochromonadaceae sp. CCMP2298]